MSGGSWDYFYLKLIDVADELAESKEPLRQAFADHLGLCAKALKDIEWVDSNDYSPGDEEEAIREAMGSHASPFELAAAIKQADKAQRDLAKALENVNYKKEADFKSRPY